MEHKKENPVTVSSLATDTVTGFTEHNRTKARLHFIVGYLLFFSNIFDMNGVVRGARGGWRACATRTTPNALYLYNLYYTTKGRTKLCSKVGLSS